MPGNTFTILGTDGRSRYIHSYTRKLGDWAQETRFGCHIFDDRENFKLRHFPEFGEGGGFAPTYQIHNS